MKLIKTSLCVVLALSILISFPANILADDYLFSLQNTKVYNSDSKEFFGQIGDTMFYYSDEDIVRKSAAYNVSTGRFEYAHYIVDSSTCYQRIETVHLGMSKNEFCLAVKSMYPSESDRVMYFETDKQNGITMEKEPSQTRWTDEQKIRRVIDMEGLPSEYSDENTRAVVVNATPVIITDTLLYSIQCKNSMLMAAATTISVVSAVVGLNSVTLLSIASFVVTAYGVYELLNDTSFTSYDVILERTKKGYINNTQYSHAWYRDYYEAKVGDIGATLSFNYSVCDSNYNNEHAIAELAYTRYSSGYSPY